ncbi:hypothetical protein [Ichthyenterobacterium magnum]|uniref:Uncharacterized protein n=1 Tax=Ichthyenterobacterium magnum TaxID=1230530 RepID=A0A420DLX1_9FLAO|nr:hypothetical protein [Ichthyenterobacterium magnum]RKE95201.1 hypothetical protein BXY80_1387 [Ichthyenterobacterium magnum]
MKVKKIRGHKRIWNDIERWKKANLYLDIEKLKHSERDYVKIWIHPFSSISLTNSQYPEPKGETKKRILNGLFDIYECWEKQLNQLNKPYYLKIWLYTPRFSKSQVVCSITNSINLYKNTFSIPENVKTFKPNSVGVAESRIKNYKWEHRVDEEFLDNTEIGQPEDFKTVNDYYENKKWFEAKLKKSHRKTEYKKPIANITEFYAFKLGDVWLGEK